MSSVNCIYLMKLLRTILIVVVLLAPLRNTQGQDFVNLDFENATVAPTPVNVYGGFVDPSFAFPGWTVGNAYGSYLATFYNDLSLGAPAISLMGPNFPNATGYSPLQGSYSVFLQYFNIAAGPPTITQTGLVPVGTQSINFLIGPGQSDAMVTLNGVDIPLVSLPDGRFGGDISAFAGSEAQLTFTTTTGGLFGEGLYFDDVQFSPSAVPEPSTSVLFIICFLFFCLQMKRPNNSRGCVKSPGRGKTSLPFDL